jgi:hypothetical protein
MQWGFNDKVGATARQLRQAASSGNKPVTTRYVYDYSGTVSLKKKKIHIANGQERRRTVESRTVGTGKAPQLLSRYIHGDHLGSTALEQDNIISCEEYYRMHQRLVAP